MGTRSIGQQQPWATREKLDRTESATRAALVEAAKRVFERLGYDKATIADITGEAAVGRATFYVYFASKEDVFALIAEAVCEDMHVAQQLKGIDAEDPWAVAVTTNAAFLDAYTANLAFIQVLEHQALADASLAVLRDQLHERPIARTARYIQGLIDAGAASPAAPPEAIARASVGMVAIYAKLIAEDPTRRSDAVAELSSMFIRLIGPHAD